MDATVSGRIRRVGNSLAFFIPAVARNRLRLKPNEEIVATISKKRRAGAIISLFGTLRGKRIAFGEGDRLDARL